MIAQFVVVSDIEMRFSPDADFGTTSAIARVALTVDNRWRFDGLTLFAKGERHAAILYPPGIHLDSGEGPAVLPLDPAVHEQILRVLYAHARALLGLPPVELLLDDQGLDESARAQDGENPEPGGET